MVDLLASLNLYRYAQLFKDQEISGRKLKTMSKEDLQVSGKSGSKIGRSVWCWWWDCYHVCCVVLVVRGIVTMSVADWVRLCMEELKWEDFFFIYQIQL